MTSKFLTMFKWKLTEKLYISANMFQKALYINNVFPNPWTCQLIDLFPADSQTTENFETTVAAVSIPESPKIESNWVLLPFRIFNLPFYIFSHKALEKFPKHD